MLPLNNSLTYLKTFHAGFWFHAFTIIARSTLYHHFGWEIQTREFKSMAKKSKKNTLTTPLSLSRPRPPPPTFPHKTHLLHPVAVPWSCLAPLGSGGAIAWVREPRSPLLNWFKLRRLLPLPPSLIKPSPLRARGLLTGRPPFPSLHPVLLPYSSSFSPRSPNIGIRGLFLSLSLSFSFFLSLSHALYLCIALSFHIYLLLFFIYIFLLCIYVHALCCISLFSFPIFYIALSLWPLLYSTLLLWKCISQLSTFFATSKDF